MKFTGLLAGGIGAAATSYSSSLEKEMERKAEAIKEQSRREWLSSEQLKGEERASGRENVTVYRNKHGGEVVNTDEEGTTSFAQATPGGIQNIRRSEMIPGDRVLNPTQVADYLRQRQVVGSDGKPRLMSQSDMDAQGTGKLPELTPEEIKKQAAIVWVSGPNGKPEQVTRQEASEKGWAIIPDATAEKNLRERYVVLKNGEIRIATPGEKGLPLDVINAQTAINEARIKQETLAQTRKEANQMKNDAALAASYSQANTYLNGIGTAIQKSETPDIALNAQFTLSAKIYEQSLRSRIDGKEAYTHMIQETAKMNDVVNRATSNQTKNFDPKKNAADIAKIRESLYGEYLRNFDAPKGKVARENKFESPPPLAIKRTEPAPVRTAYDDIVDPPPGILERAGRGAVEVTKNITRMLSDQASGRQSLLVLEAKARNGNVNRQQFEELRQKIIRKYNLPPNATASSLQPILSPPGIY